MLNTLKTVLIVNNIREKVKVIKKEDDNMIVGDSYKKRDHS